MSLQTFIEFSKENFLEDWKNELIGLPSSTQPTMLYKYLCDKINLEIAKTKQLNSNDENSREVPGVKSGLADTDPSENQENADASHTMELD